MSHSEIDAVRELLRSQPRPTGFAERRERLDAIGSTSPVATDIRLEATDANGVAAEWSLAPGSDPSRVLLFFQGGGYCSGSRLSTRSLRRSRMRAQLMAFFSITGSPRPGSWSAATARVAGSRWR